MNLFKSNIVKGTLILTLAGIITRLIGFAYKIYLADILGSTLLGIYQLIFPVYGICFTIYGAGVQTAISQLIASNISATAKRHLSPLKIFISGCAIAFTLAAILSATVYLNCSWIATYLILAPTAAPYLQILAVLFPFCSISACISGYYYGIQNAKIPATSQLVEQLARVAFVCALCTFMPGDRQFNCTIAVWGLTVGEIAGSLFNIINYLNTYNNNRHKLSASMLSTAKATAGRLRLSTTRSTSANLSPFKPLISLTFTLTSTKLVIALLHSVEAIFIPAALSNYGYTSAEALSIYGILAGMALPFILFPSTISNSFAVMLLPAIAKSWSEQNTKHIRKLVTITTQYSILIGWLFTDIFMLFGNRMGILFFDNNTAGSFITILAWLCPFLYLSTTFTSIINGLGKTQLTFIITVISISIKIYALIVLVPRYGIKAYLIATLLSQIIMTILEGIYLNKYIIPDVTHWVILPLIFLSMLSMASKYTYSSITLNCTKTTEMLLLGGVCVAIMGIYILCLQISGCISIKKEVFENKRR